jgi:6-phosphogluconate dehydrogenase
MTDVKRELGIVGLGKMGANLALHALELGIAVAGNDRTKPAEELIAAGLTEIGELAGFRDALERPRAVFLYIPAGSAVDELIDELSEVLEKGDVIVDAGNSYWGDSIRRHARLAERRLRFVDLGTSGGISGARHGACFMAGGEREAVERIEPILIELAVEGGYVHAGPPGAGHFTKLVHNGIEFGMLQAIAEGIDLLEHHRDELPIAEVLHCWRHGSVIRSWLVDLMEESYRERRGVENTPDYVEDTGEVNWLLDDAMHMEVSIPVITQAVMQLIASRDPDHLAPRAIAQMRHGFGGHPFGPDERVRRERREGRVEGYLPPDHSAM